MWNDPEWKSNIPNMFTILKNNIPHHVVALHRGTQADDAFKEESCVDYKMISLLISLSDTQII